MVRFLSSVYLSAQRTTDLRTSRQIITSSDKGSTAVPLDLGFRLGEGEAGRWSEAWQAGCAASVSPCCPLASFPVVLSSGPELTAGSSSEGISPEDNEYRQAARHAEALVQGAGSITGLRSSQLVVSIGCLSW